MALERPRFAVIAIALLAAAALPVHAQDRPFVFSVTTPVAVEPGRSAFRLDYDVGTGERVFQANRGNQPEQQLALYASRGRYTVVGRVNLISTGSAYQSEQSAELLVSLRLPARTGTSLAVGGGALRELTGTNVLLARVVGGHETEGWRLHGNVLVQKPLASGRDAVDLISTIGWARRLTPAVALGVEAVAEDVEGFWEAEETEGGARFLLGPSLHVAPAGRKWQVTATGGPTFHPNDTGRSSDASRDLPPSNKRYGYAVKAAVTYAFR